MKEIQWSLTKNEQLKKTRGVSFDEMIQSNFVSAMKHPSKKHQNIMLFERKGYIWVVPYVEDEKRIFLKTLFPSRKYTKIYKRGEL